VSTAEVAVKWAANFHVVRLLPGTNRPFTPGWQLPENRLSPEAARQAWQGWPAMNLGIVAWPEHWVLDLDGPSAIEWFGATFGRRADQLTLTVRTPGRGGGLHLWFRVPMILGSQRLRQHLAGCAQAELKYGPGRQTAVPPSTRPEGVYRWLDNGHRSPASTPVWLAQAVVTETPTLAPAAPVGLGELASEGGVWGEAATAALSGAVASISRRVASEREARNNVLFWGAMRLLELGVGDKGLRELAAAASLTGLSESEINRTIQSAKEKTR
jgi:hypothetical protein